MMRLAAELSTRDVYRDRETQDPDTGLVGWPTIFRYRMDDGRVLAVLPETPDCRYWIEVYDHRAYDALTRAGLVYGSIHRAGQPVLVDNRRTS